MIELFRLDLGNFIVAFALLIQRAPFINTTQNEYLLLITACK
jgi:hypothetical protein